MLYQLLQKGSLQCFLNRFDFQVFMLTTSKIKRPVQTSRLPKSNLVIARMFIVSAQANPEHKEQFTKRTLK